MKFSDISHELAFALIVVAIVAIIYAVWHDHKLDKRHPGGSEKYKQFARELSVKLDQIPDLDEGEKQQIEDKMRDIIKKKDEKKAHKMTKKCATSAMRGCIVGAMTGGLEAAVVGAVVFGAIAPVIEIVETQM